MQGAFKLHELRLSVRFVRGYRYLDLAGEALVRLEDELEQGWVPAEISPRGGAMHNHTLGMQMAFSSDGVNVTQTEVISAPHFVDQACRTLDVLATVLKVDTFIAPSVGAEYQRGFEFGEDEQAEAALQALGIISTSPKAAALLGDTVQAVTFAMVHKVSQRWRDVPTGVTRRLAGAVVHQARRETPVERLLIRTKLLPERQRDAVFALAAISKMAPSASPVAVRIELENRLEGEVARNDLPCADLLADSLEWFDTAINSLVRD